MAQANASIRISVSPDKVWQLIGGFNSLPDWLPYIPSSELSEGGRVRRLATPNGDVIVERLEAFDNRARSYTYSILEAPFPVTGYRSTLLVREGEEAGASLVEIGEALGGRNHSTVLYSCERVADLAAADSQVKRHIQTIMQALRGAPILQSRQRRR